MTSTSVDRRFGVNVGAAVKVPCRLATTANMDLNGLDAVDGIVPAQDDRILVKNQTVDSENGIYYADSGDWERCPDFDGKYDIKKGTLVKVNAGATNQGFWYVSSSDWPTVDTDSITFAMSSSVLAVLSAFTQTLTPLTTAAAWRTALAVPSTTEAILQSLLTTKGDIIGASAASTAVRKGIGTDGYRLSANSGDTDGLRYLPPGMGFNLINGYLDWTVAGNALTCTVKGYDGNAPSATNPVFAWIRSSVAATGSPTLAKLTSATTASLSSGSTGGTRNAIPFNVWAVLADDAGTYRLGLVQCLTTVANAGSGSDVTAIYQLGQFPIISSTAEGGAGAADSAAVVYSTVAWTSKPYAVLGYAYFAAGQAAAGTWATAPTRQHLYMPGTPLPGQRVQLSKSISGAVATGATVTPEDDTLPQNTEGDQYFSLSITTTSAANPLHISAQVYGSSSSAGARTTTQLHVDAVANTVGVTSNATPGANQMNTQGVAITLLAATIAAVKLRMGGTAGTYTLNGNGGVRSFAGAGASFLQVEEVQG